MDIIQLLPDHVASQIAAGEVIQRPASAVKEMLENALDAGSAEIKLFVKDAGKSLLQVVDNGCGMSKSDVKMCFERHATSKIKSADDLFNIQTMGFRGEAMASIAAIAHIEVKTKLTSKELGTHLVIEGSEIKTCEDCATANGTSIKVKNLFYNVPARRNFLKSDKVEMRHINEEFIRVSLANPNVKMHLFHNENEIFHLPKNNFRKRIVNIIGGKKNEALVPIEEETTVVKIGGFVGKPEAARRTRGEQYFFVNGRYIKSHYLHHAVSKAFEELIPNNYFPSYFINLMIDPKLIDINIHPTKTEIKFENETSIYAIIRSAVKHSLGKYNVAPTINFNQETSFDILPEKGKVYKQPIVKIDKNFNPFEKEKPTEIFSWGDVVQEEKTTSQQDIGVEWKSELDNKKLVQIANQFIVFEGENGLNILHQHRAHQRVLFEYYQKAFENRKTESQKLAFTQNLSFSNTDFSLVKQLKEALHNLGFGFNLKKENQIEITAIPTECKNENLEDIFDEILQQEKNDEKLKVSTQDKIAKVLAKSLSIKSGKKLETQEISLLVNNLFACNLPTICPNGNPTIINLSFDDISKHF